MRFLTPPTAADHKYSRGVLGVHTGSDQYPGAAVLGIEAAWRTGIGMVRYVPSSTTVSSLVSQLVLQRRPETVIGDGAVDAWLIGSGIDFSRCGDEVRDGIRTHLRERVPLVLDAGALEALDVVEPPSAPIIVTPHEGELRALWARTLGGSVALETAEDRRRAATTAAAQLGVTVLLKGSVTVLASPTGVTAQTDVATPWLATAGTGDVLGGILGALVAAYASRVLADPDALVALGHTAATVHATAALIASVDHGHSATAGRPITALDVAEAIPFAVQQLRER